MDKKFVIGKLDEHWKKSDAIQKLIRTILVFIYCAFIISFVCMVSIVLLKNNNASKASPYILLSALVIFVVLVIGYLPMLYHYHWWVVDDKCFYYYDLDTYREKIAFIIKTKFLMDINQEFQSQVEIPLSSINKIHILYKVHYGTRVRVYFSIFIEVELMDGTRIKFDSLLNMVGYKEEKIAVFDFLSEKGIEIVDEYEIIDVMKADISKLSEHLEAKHKERYSLKK